MWRNVLLLIVFLVPFTAGAQKRQLPAQHSLLLRSGDTLHHAIVIKDSLKIYHDIKNIASRHKFTYMLYKFIFNDPQRVAIKQAAVTHSDSAKVMPDDFSQYDGAYIRRIEIRTLDPFGSAVNDTAHSMNFLKSAGNKLHIRSTRLTIKNQLLFRRGRQFDALAVRESERILRQSPYVRDARIFVSPASSGCDTIDVTVIVQDRWSLGASAGLSTRSSSVHISEKNFLGLAHQVTTDFKYNIPDKTGYRFSGSYTIPYIKNTFITGTAFYSNTQFDFTRGFSFSRPFYSPLAKWSYGLTALRLNTAQSFLVNDTVVVSFPLDYYQQDAWIGRSFQLIKGRSVARRSTKGVLSARCINTNYTRRASFGYDTLRLNQDTRFTLGSIGFFNERYYKDINIYKFGEAEDVPEGRSLEFTGGYQQREFNDRWYAGVKAAIGNHIDHVGYFSGAVGYGSFFYRQQPEDGVLNMEASYFTDNWRWGRWAGRQFIFVRSATGYNRERPERITLDHERSLYGFSSDVLSGSKKITLNTVSVAYLPYKVIGFRFAAIAFAGMGMIGNKGTIWNNTVYQAYGIGVLVRNDHLVFNTFMVSFGIYPNVPNRGTVYKVNPISTYNFGFNDFLLSRPDIIPYR